MNFWSQKYTRYVGLVLFVISIYFARYIADSIGIKSTGIESSWQIWIANILLIVGALCILLVLTKWIWKSVSIPQA